MSEVAWSKTDALDLLEHFKSAGHFVLGGDVLALETDCYQHNYDNWHFNYEDGHAQESIEQAINYINNYPAGDYAFVLVTD
ncbi:MAG: hypothetical protein HN736_04265 [Anaerolineae bacterium]|nr:hypothetical protein [Anaerolineae bacterium]MBT3713431.1 hypothetical protein [Anaerolineae bacterium]MBT4310409.1 hypothetical protein [Anaerolineae bacterium]MBT4456875.1 hypothetical protein [Anaerolineae bacterium]MBT4842833.1 hypothetical protein [Anaerolineae bacterium]